MPQPTSQSVHVNRPLTNLSVAFTQQQKDFVAGTVFPYVKSKKQGDNYFEYDRAYWYRNNMKKRAPGTESAGSGYKVDGTPNFYCDVFALHRDIADQERDNADDPIDLDREATEWLSLQGMINQEIEWAANNFTTGVWTGSDTGTDITPTILWSASGSDPVGDIDEQRSAMKEKTGYWPNTLVIGDLTFRGLKNNADIKDRVKYTQRAVITIDMLASLFELERVMLATGVQNTAAEGATPAYSFIANSKDAWLAYVNPSPGVRQPSAGYTFAWTGHVGAGPQGQAISRFRIDRNKADRVEIEQAFDQKVVAPDLGVFFNGAVA